MWSLILGIGLKPKVLIDIGLRFWVYLVCIIDFSLKIDNFLGKAIVTETI